jgi:hypothetical protein
MKRFLILLSLETIIIWLFIFQLHPDPSISISILIYAPAVFLINILTAILLLLWKHETAKLFFLNALIAPFVLYFIFNYEVERGLSLVYKTYNFESRNRKFELCLDLTKGKLIDSNDYSINERLPRGSSVGSFSGKYFLKGDSIFLNNEIHLMVVYDNSLYQFPLEDYIRLKNN